MTDDDATRHLLDRFLHAVRLLPSLRAVWAHGSLAGGDYRPGRSDLDLIAVVARRCPPDEEEFLTRAHTALDASLPLAEGLHCTYVAADEWADPDRPHFTWAHRQTQYRPVTPVTRRELHAFGRVLHGPPPADLLPPVGDADLAGFVRRDLRTYWRPAVDHPDRWLQDIWVDLGLLTLARARVTLATGRLITKGEALDVLTGLGAPADVVDDIRRRRYGTPPPASPAWRARRADATRAFLAPAIERTLTEYDPPAAMA
ncbi:nucleotidyltransferase domain-containing protein [Streptomyces griseosporeus]|uniref:nucleotidyltransferase domain-containing protein n=1 Tax=Streptomyces griseosporeus TaxID=1910 RepID=UPI0037003FD2